MKKEINKKANNPMVLKKILIASDFVQWLTLAFSLVFIVLWILYLIPGSDEPTNYIYRIPSKLIRPIGISFAVLTVIDLVMVIISSIFAKKVGSLTTKIMSKTYIICMCVFASVMVVAGGIFGFICFEGRSDFYEIGTYVNLGIFVLVLTQAILNTIVLGKKKAKK